MQIIELMDIFNQLNNKHNGVCRLTYINRPMHMPDMAIHLRSGEILINDKMCQLLSTPSKAVFALAHEFAHFLNKDDNRVHYIGQLECEKQADLYARDMLLSMDLSIVEAIDFIHDLAKGCSCLQRPTHPEYFERVDALITGYFSAEKEPNYAND